jgi:hypothetical protein
MSADTLTSLLNRCTAIIRSGCASVKSLGKDIGEHPARVSEWVTQRTVEPRGSTAMKLHTWAAKKTVQISRCDNAVQQRFRAEYKLACDRFPATGAREG